MGRVSAEKAIAALQSGDRIMVTHPDPMKVSDKTSYALVQGGGSLTATTFRKISSKLEPVSDGLFPDEPSQTYRLANDAS